ncbi:MAG: sulfurtransferase complex subunit TusB [Candidatus Bathyarchaeota archaeon]|nr:sulfurtransferase complex subunit TusB [Candidatus Bathyarchaeota archaeon]
MKKLFVLKKKDPTPLGIVSSLGKKGRDVAVALMLDAVYLAAEKGEQADAVQECVESGVEVYILEKDAERRGLRDRIIQEAKMVDYAGLVDLLFAEETSVINL